MGAAVGFTFGFSPVPHHVAGKWPPPEPPQFEPWDRTNDSWWHNMLHEAGIAQSDFIAPVTRSENPLGANPGDASPLELRPLVRLLQDCLDRQAGAAIEAGRKVPLLAPFVDTGAHNQTWTHIHTGVLEEGEVDLSHPDVWELFWTHDLEHFFDLVPAHQLFRIDDRVLVFFWGVAAGQHYRNHEGNLSRILDKIRLAARSKFGYELFTIPDHTWAQLDSTFDQTKSEGLHGWFMPPRPFSVRRWRAQAFGVSVPGFIDPSDAPNPAWTIDRREGAALRAAFRAFLAANVRVVLLEGLTDWEESAGFYRSSKWPTATH